jgi:hypothetical protein
MNNFNIHLPSNPEASKLFALQVKVKFTLRLAVYRQSVGLGAKPLEVHGQRFFLNELLPS